MRDLEWKKHYCDWKDVKEMTGVGRAKCYEILKELNTRLEAEHKFVRPGYAPRWMVEEYLAIR